MIPIECPNCGRGGNVPPDRLNARLVCRGCQTVFHLDNTGRLIEGDPGSGGSKQGKPRGKKARASEIDLAQTWKDIPKPVKYGVPGILLALFGYMFLSSLESGPSYLQQAGAAMRAVVANDRSRAVSYSSSDSADATGKWFDLLHGELEKVQIGRDSIINPALLNGNPDNDSEISLMVVLAKPGVTGTLTINVQMRREGGAWTIEGKKSLANAESDLAAARKSP